MDETVSNNMNITVQTPVKSSYPSHIQQSSAVGLLSVWMEMQHSNTSSLKDCNTCFAETKKT